MSSVSRSTAAPQENISQLRLMYQALLDPPGGLTGPHVVLGEKKRNTVHTLAKHGSTSQNLKERRRSEEPSRLLMISSTSTHGKWIMLNAAGWNSFSCYPTAAPGFMSRIHTMLLLTRHNSHYYNAVIIIMEFFIPKLSQRCEAARESNKSEEQQEMKDPHLINGRDPSPES